MFVHHKLIHLHPFIIVRPIAIIEFKTHAPIVTQTHRKFDASRPVKIIGDYFGNALCFDMSDGSTDLGRPF